MPHPEITNKTPFVVEPLYLNDEEFVPVLTLVVKATYDIVGNQQLRLADEQAPLCLAGEYWGEPGESSLKYEPECVYFKPAADIVLIGHAYPERKNDASVKVGIRVGPARKIVQVFGDRQWTMGPSHPIATAPAPFEKIPLIYERAFGGKDPRGDDGEKISQESRNPMGVGYRDPLEDFEEGVPLPNLENPDDLIRAYNDAPAPVGFGFIEGHWEPRIKYAGTYDETWEKTRRPLLPFDFNKKFYNAASPGLVLDGYLAGNEEVTIVNASPRGRLQFFLPNLPAPECHVQLQGGAGVLRDKGELDTLIVNTDEHKVFLIWRCVIPLNGGFNSVAEINAQIPGVEVMKHVKLES
ncbi:DUF2169 domain-containing protein [Hahella sp. CR1]|uniref:DUF2169 family type VI secretion system accessory protein n=1 Tax=Hahella sp. CR1 TaxID=2992807 RepID=UPI002442C447|nr:DUF2169 domain-containing protein [Hahella sp. CR1]MDG9668042.1 DUF2169 domain-containing protein [Hahella sp. CR1]